MFRVLVLISFIAISVIYCGNFNETLFNDSRVKRQNSDENQCGEANTAKGFISGGHQIRRGDFPW